MPPLILKKRVYEMGHKNMVSLNPTGQLSGENQNKAEPRTESVLEMYFSLKI